MSIKKVIAGTVAVLAMGAFSAASAQVMSIGGGAFFSGGFGGGVTGDWIDFDGSYRYEESYTMKMPFIGGGINVFFDATYVEASLGLLFAGGTWAEEYEYKDFYNGNLIGYGKGNDDNAKSSFTAFNMGALGKYPIYFGSMTVFPAFGIQYQMVLSGKTNFDYGDGDTEEMKWDGKQTCEMYGGDIECWGNPKASDFNTLWFKFGGGLDYDLSETMFLRSSLLYGIRLSNKIEEDWEDGGGTRLGHGLDIRVGVGFRL